MVETPMAAETSDHRLQSRVLSLLAPSENDQLAFSDDGLAKVGVIIEVAARLKSGITPLLTMVRLMTALDQKGHREAASQLASCFRASPMAMGRLRSLRNHDREVSAAFDRFADRRPPHRAPAHDAARPPKTVALKTLLPPGAGRRPPPARRPARPSGSD